MNKGAVLGLEGGTKVVMDTIAKIRAFQGSLDDVAAVWLQDWTGQRRFNNSGHDIARVGLWWNWEVRPSVLAVVCDTHDCCACISAGGLIDWSMIPVSSVVPYQPALLLHTA